MTTQTEKDYGPIARQVEAVADTIWDMASNVWTFAELGMEEEQSSSYESAVLEKNGFTISDRGIGGIDTSWIATYGSGTPVIVAVSPCSWMSAPRRASSWTCMKRFSKMVSRIILVPEARVTSAIICA